MSEGPGLFDGRTACIDAWRALLIGLPEAAPAEVWCLAPDFADWPLDEPAVLDALTRWARPAGRRLHLVAQSYDLLQRSAPRLVAWRRSWGHVLDARQSSPGERVELPQLLWTGRAALEVLDPVHWRARRWGEPSALRTLLERIDAIAQRCEPGWAVTTLGL